ncbi:MAG: hypothetical protein AAGJ87_05575 [Pseudomonadota bacterium]
MIDPAGIVERAEPDPIGPTMVAEAELMARERRGLNNIAIGRDSLACERGFLSSENRFQGFRRRGCRALWRCC